MKSCTRLGLPWQSISSNLIIVLLVHSFGFCKSDCEVVSGMDSACPTGKSAVYSNTGGNLAWITYCCTEDQFKNERLYAASCKKTNCLDANTELECTTLKTIPQRMRIDGADLEYEEVAKDQCKDRFFQTIGTQLLCCPKGSTDTLVTTLYGTEPHEFPHFVKLGASGCGATLYNSKFVLTAAHCVIDNTGPVPHNPWDPEVSPVRINIDIEGAYTTATYNVKKIHIHPESSFLKPVDPYDPSFNDVAILELEKDVEFSDSVKALRIPQKGYKPMDYGTHAVIAGYGIDDSYRNQQRILKANVLLRSMKDVMDNPQSSQYFASKRTDQWIAVGGIFNGKANPAAGTGDSGGPAICRDANGEAILCGITSFTGTAVATCLDNLNEDTCPPSAYVDVQYFSDWIREVAGPQVEDQLMKKKLFGYPAQQRGAYAMSQVYITASGTQPCSGTLVDQDMVLTAAHCVTDYVGNAPTPRDNVQIVSGVYDLKDIAKGRNHTVSTMSVYGGFKVAEGSKAIRKKRVVSMVLETWQRGLSSKPVIMETPYYFSDLVLIKLDQMAQGTPAMVGGIKRNHALANEVAYPKSNGTLSIREMKILSRYECQKRLDRLKVLNLNPTLEEIVMCGVEPYSGGSLCDRSLGGGLFCKGANGREELCGVQTFRLCEFNIPNGFIDLGNPLISGWINNARESLRNFKPQP